MRNRLLIVNDADSLIAILADVKNNTNRVVYIEDSNRRNRTEYVNIRNMFRGKSHWQSHGAL